MTLAQEILTEVREQKDYWQEKATAKLVAFFEIQQELFYRYAELKDYHTQMAKVIEGQSIPGLKEISEEAEKLWADLNKNHE